MLQINEIIEWNLTNDEIKKLRETRDKESREKKNEKIQRVYL